jgi:pimeloyl-ACP methyl ester carboxylesterase
MEGYGVFELRDVPTKYGNVHVSRRRGEGKKLLLIHGLASSMKTWSRFVGFMPKNTDLCMIDLLGHGLSDSPRMDYTLDTQLYILKKVIETEEFDNAYLMGHSYGGWIATAYAMSNSVNGLILEDAAGLKEFYDNVRGTEEREALKKKMLHTALELGAKEHVIKSILDDEFRDGQLTEDDFSRIKTHALIIWGENDQVIDPAFAQIFHDRMEGSEVVIIKGSKHTPHFTNPEDVAREVERFISKT